MLRSTFLPNAGVPSSLRNIITPHAGLRLLRFRLDVMQKSISNVHYRRSLQSGNGSLSFSTSSRRLNTYTSPNPIPSTSKKESTASSSNSSNESSLPANTPSSIPLPEPMEPKLSLTFTCTVSGCGERSTHQFTKRAYEKGIVLVQCPGCANRHLIADHLGWFKESTQEGKLCTVEDLLKAKGEKVRRGRLDAGGTVEYIE